MSEGLIFEIRPENNFQLPTVFLQQYAGKQPNFGPVGYVTYRRTYSRRLTPLQRSLRDELGILHQEASTEEFWETAQRVVNGTFSILKQQIRSAHQPWDDEEAQEKAEEMYRRMWSFKFLPPGRGLWFMGTEALQKLGSAALNNCGFVSTENIDTNFSEPFTMLMDYLMLGVGMGFDVLGAGKITLEEPIINKDWTLVVEDSREGWVEALRVMLEAFVGRGMLPRQYDYSKVREEGAPLITFGGTSSGPQPLIDLLDNLKNILMKGVGQPITSTQITDIQNIIGKCVVAGNVRRSSEIALGDPTDTDFISLKDPKDLNLWGEQQQKIALGIPEYCLLGRQMVNHRHTLSKLSVLDPEYLAISEKISDLQAEQRQLCMKNSLWKELQDKIEKHPLRTHRWASNNTIMCHRGQDYTDLAKQTVTNGEPGYAWPEIFKSYGRLVDEPNFKDRKAKGFNPCVPAGTKILTRDGYKPIEELIGSEVTIWNGENWAQVTPKVTGTDQPLVQVHLSDGTSLVCTEYHEWILAPKKGNLPEERVKAIDLQPGDTLAKFEMPVVESSKDWDLAYTHGFFCGDGQITSESGAKGALLYGEKQRLTSVLTGTSTGITDKYDRIWIGFPKEIPEKYFVPFDVTVTARINWLAGLLDADGCVLKNPNSVGIQLSSSKPEFLKEVRLMLTTLGVQAKVAKARESTYRDMPDGKGGVAPYLCQDDYRLLINAADTYKLINLGLKTHRLDLPALKPQRDARRFVTVLAVEKKGVADKVYCYTESRTHRGTFEGIVTGQCGEQTLWDRELCCLVETFPTNHESLDDYLQTLKYAYLYAKTVTLVPTHNPATNAVMTRNRRIGTSMAGIIEMYCKLGMQECIRWWDTGYRFLRELDAEYSGWMGVGESIKVTSVKPGGTIPLLPGVEGGMKAPTSKFYMRTIRIDYASPLITALEKAGYRVEKDLTTPRTMVAYFPVEEKRCERTAEDIGLWEQAAIFTAVQRYWADNMVSATLTFKPNEAKDLQNILQVYEGQWKCTSFLPLLTHGFAQAPYIPCTQQEYMEAVAKLKTLQLEGVGHEEDEKYCAGGVCEVSSNVKVA